MAMFQMLFTEPTSLLGALGVPLLLRRVSDAVRPPREALLDNPAARRVHFTGVTAGGFHLPLSTSSFGQ